MKQQQNRLQSGRKEFRKYYAPAVLRTVSLDLESELMAASVSDSTTVRTMGQRVVDFVIIDNPTDPFADNTFGSPGWDNNPWQ